MAAYLTYPQPGKKNYVAREFGSNCHFYTEKKTEALKFSSSATAEDYAAAIPWIRDMYAKGLVKVEEKADA